MMMNKMLAMEETEAEPDYRFSLGLKRARGEDKGFRNRIPNDNVHSKDSTSFLIFLEPGTQRDGMSSKTRELHEMIEFCKKTTTSHCQSKDW